MNVARESTVERMGDDELLDERGALDRRVTRGSEDSPPVLGPCSELDARRLDPAPQDMSCDMGKLRGPSHDGCRFVAGVRKR